MKQTSFEHSAGTGAGLPPPAGDHLPGDHPTGSGCACPSDGCAAAGPAWPPAQPESCFGHHRCLCNAGHGRSAAAPKAQAEAAETAAAGLVAHKPCAPLSIGGGHVILPLPTIQLPGAFRTPGIRQAVVPVAVPEYAVATSATAVAAPALASVAVPAVVPTAAPSVSAVPPAQRVQRCIPEEEVAAFLQVLRQQQAASPQHAGPAASNGQPSPQELLDEVQRLRSQLGEMSRELQGAYKALERMSPTQP